MRKIFALTLSTLFIFSYSRADQVQIAGKWAADTRTKGGLGSSWVFEKDGTATYTFGALVDFKYQVEGKTIKTIFENSTTGKSETDLQSFEILGNKLIIDPSEPEKRQEMNRVGNAISNAVPLVGIWEFKHYTGAMATMQYTTTGLAQLSVPFQNTKGKYRLRSNELIIMLDGQSDATKKIQLNGDQLVFLPNSKDGELKYSRVLP
ncbi:hypothetical protein [Limnohabitans sp.]|jgi:hypothetical protein|uniref:hypothetical protein n=1 Tax=Limnohabitans sp. TaxID=1907725 RepID=UPI003918A57E